MIHIVEKCLFPLDAHVVSCPTCAKNLEWYLVSIFYYDCITIAGFAASFASAILSQLLFPATIQATHKLWWSD